MRANPDLLGGVRRLAAEQKNLQLVNGLASFDMAVDCAGANNRLKRSNLEFEVRPYRGIARANFGFQRQQKTVILVWLRFGSSLKGLSAGVQRTSEPKTH
jgi:hypothetical protein